MSQYLMQAPVIIFFCMAASFAIILGPIAIADLLRQRPIN